MSWESGPGTESKARFGATLRFTLGEAATVSSVEQKAVNELRDLDVLTTEKEVTNVVKVAFEGTLRQISLCQRQIRGEGKDG